jgi:hypothetical protein
MNYARFFIWTGYGIEMLKQVDITTWSKDLPSWIPDWTSYNLYTPWLGQDGEPGRVIYRAGGDSDDATIIQLADELSLCGFIFDKIDRLGQDHRSVSLEQISIDPRSIDGKERGDFLSCISEPLEMLQDGSFYETPLKNQQAASSTFMVGRLPPDL